MGTPIEEADHRYETRSVEFGEPSGETGMPRPTCKACGSTNLWQEALPARSRGPPGMP